MASFEWQWQLADVDATEMLPALTRCNQSDCFAWIGILPVGWPFTGQEGRGKNGIVASIRGILRACCGPGAESQAIRVAIVPGIGQHGWDDERILAAKGTGSDGEQLGVGQGGRGAKSCTGGCHCANVHYKEDCNAIKVSNEKLLNNKVNPLLISSSRASDRCRVSHGSAIAAHT